jgi:photosystem II stability/assembly factor-like uncharacterized protein
MPRIFSLLVALVVACALVIGQASSLPRSNHESIVTASAKRWAEPTQFMMLDATMAGSRIVAVGEHGVIVLSEDGATFRQAKSVPVDSTLTAVTFVDERHGWAVGQWGVILATADGGETWELMRVEMATDQPLFSVLFKNANVGWAVGLWSLLLKTEDGGKTWGKINLPKPPDGGNADRNLYKIWSDKGGTLYIAAEHGTVVRSRDGGNSWDYLDTGYKGSLWTGLATENGMLYVAGLRGTLFRSADEGATWSRLDSGVPASITGLAEDGKRLVGVGLDGHWFERQVDSSTATAHQLADRTALTGVIRAKPGQFILISKTGIRPLQELPFQ